MRLKSLYNMLYWYISWASAFSHVHSQCSRHTHRQRIERSSVWCNTKPAWVAVSQKQCALWYKPLSADQIVWWMVSWKLPMENLASCPIEKHPVTISFLPGVFWGIWAQNKPWQVTGEEWEMAVTCSSRWMLAASWLCSLVLFWSLDTSFYHSFGPVVFMFLVACYQMPHECVLNSLHVFCFSAWYFNCLIPHGLWVILEDLANNLLSTNHKLGFAAMCSHKHLSLLLGFLMPQITSVKTVLLPASRAGLSGAQHSWLCLCLASSKGKGPQKDGSAVPTLDHFNFLGTWRSFLCVYVGQLIPNGWIGPF